MQTLSERLRWAMMKTGVSQIALARACGVSQPSVHGWLSGKSKFLRGENLLAAADALQVSRQWLATGDGSPDDSVAPRPVTVSTRETRPGYVRLPHYSAEVSAGAGAEMDAAGFEVVQTLDVAKWWAEQHLPRDLSRVRVLSVRGDSMAPDMQHGDVLFVDTATASFDSPGLYVINFQGRALVKRLVPELRTGRVAIISSNPAYPPEYVEPGELDSLHIGGRVAAWWTLRKF